MFVDSLADKVGLIEIIAKLCSGRIDHNSVLTNWGIVDIFLNSDHSDTQKNDPLKGFLFYPYLIEMDLETNIERSEYVQRIRLLLEGLRSSGYKVVAACDFEDEITIPK